MSDLVIPNSERVAYKNTYASNVEVLLQQQESKLRSTVTEEPIDGETRFFDQTGPVETKIRTSPKSDLEPSTSPMFRRAVSFFERYYSELINKQSQLRLVMDPTGIYAKNGMMSLNRAIDDLILDAMFGTALTGHDGTVPVPITGNSPAGYAAVPVIPNGGTGLTVSKLITAKQILMENENDPDTDPMTLVYSPEQMANLLNTTQVTSSDYNTVKALVEGKLDTFMGFKFVVSNRLPANGASNSRQVPVYSKTAIKLGVAQNVVTSLDWVPMKRNWLLYLGWMMGAVRMQEKKMVIIECVEV